jgi:single-stranded-DNA-specific exonuclease
VASRLVDLYARPALLIALRQDSAASGPGAEVTLVGQGSGRSVPGFPLHRALEACGEHLISHGGHAAAAGFRIQAELIEGFRARFCEYADRHFQAQPLSPRIVLDAEVPLSIMTYNLVRDLDHLEPYGADNRRPVFLASGLQVAEAPKLVGGGERHLSFRVKQGSTTLRAIAFGMAERLEELMSAGGACCLAFTPRQNDWQGFRRVDLEVIDFQPGAEARLA